MTLHRLMIDFRSRESLESFAAGMGQQLADAEEQPIMLREADALDLQGLEKHGRVKRYVFRVVDGEHPGQITSYKPRVIA